MHDQPRNGGLRRVVTLTVKSPAPPTTLQEPNVLSGPYIDRAAHLRKDEQFISRARQDPDSRLVPVWRSRNLLRRHSQGLAAVVLPAGHRLFRSAADSTFVLLGRFRGQTCFAVNIESEEPPATDRGTRFEDLRVAAGQLPREEAGLLAYARAMVSWQKRHRFCGVCGAGTRPADGGHVVRCVDETCGAQHFPRLDPAIIVLVTDGKRALLGRQAVWPEGRYSTIAGFVEPGESLEDAVAREVQEETGVEILRSDYHSSQPWPFPSSLMIGYTALAKPGAVAVADDELEDVRWFTRDEIASGFPGLPPPQSVSFRLIEDWYDAGSPQRLRDTAGVRFWTPPAR